MPKQQPNSIDPFSGDNLFEQFANISKAGAYDILVDQVKELKGENEKLKEERNQWVSTSNAQIKKWAEEREALIKALQGLYNSIDKQLLNYRFGEEIGIAKEVLQIHTK